MLSAIIGDNASTINLMPPNIASCTRKQHLVKSFGKGAPWKPPNLIGITISSGHFLQHAVRPYC